MLENKIKKCERKHTERKTGKIVRWFIIVVRKTIHKRTDL